MKPSIRRSQITALVLHPWLPFFVLAVGTLIWHLTRELYFSDDLWFRDILGGEDLWTSWGAFLAQRYTGWSSRLLVEGVLILIVHLPNLWRLLDSAAILWLAVGLSRLFNRENRADVNWIIVGGVFLLPLSMLSSAGWIATTLNYLWPLSLGLAAFLPLSCWVRKERCPWYLCLIALPALLYACNQEQMCAAVVGVFLCFGVYLFWRDRKLPWFLLVEFLLALASMLFILTCPGNDVRAEAEGSYFPAFAGFSLPHKLELGYASALYPLVMQPNLIFLLLSAFLMMSVWAVRTHPAARLLSAIPLGAGLFFGLFGDRFAVWFPALAGLRDRLTETGTGVLLQSPSTWLPDLILMLVCLSAAVSFWLAIPHRPTALLALFLTVLGVGTQIILGFSASIWHSGQRTLFYLYFALIAVVPLLYTALKQTGKRSWATGLLALWLTLGSLTFLDQLLTRP